MANVSFHVGTTTPSASGLTTGGIYVNSSTGGIWYAKSASSRLPLGFNAPVTSAGTAKAYTATVGHILSLTPGVSFVMVPHIDCNMEVTSDPTLNVNSLGAKQIRRRVASGYANSTTTLYADSSLKKDIPVRLMYDGTYWIIEGQPQAHADDMYGSISIGLNGSSSSVGVAWKGSTTSTIYVPSSATELFFTYSQSYKNVSNMLSYTSDSGRVSTTDCLVSGYAHAVKDKKDSSIYHAHLVANGEYHSTKPYNAIRSTLGYFDLKVSDRNYIKGTIVNHLVSMPSGTAAASYYAELRPLDNTVSTYNWTTLIATGLKFQGYR